MCTCSEQEVLKYIEALAIETYNIFLYKRLPVLKIFENNPNYIYAYPDTDRKTAYEYKTEISCPNIDKEILLKHIKQAVVKTDNLIPCSLSKTQKGLRIRLNTEECANNLLTGVSFIKLDFAKNLKEELLTLCEKEQAEPIAVPEGICTTPITNPGGVWYNHGVSIWPGEKQESKKEKCVKVSTKERKEKVNDFSLENIKNAIVNKVTTLDKKTITILGIILLLLLIAMRYQDIKDILIGIKNKVKRSKNFKAMMEDGTNAVNSLKKIVGIKDTDKTCVTTNEEKEANEK